MVFAIAAFTYVSTLEPTASFWDCPEFILSGYKLEVGHPPGAPFYMLAANVVSQLAADKTQVAYMVNLMNALLSAATVMFLFWTITHLVRQLSPCEKHLRSTRSGAFVAQWRKNLSKLSQLAPQGLLAGFVGALIYCFSDTFWFSAVEGEVYAFSSFFTAIVFWLILKWEEHADEPHADRYLVLIAYMTGLSIGVHLLNLLCLPSIVLVWYYRRHPDATLRGSLKALAVSFLLLAGVLYGVIPGIVKMAGWCELLFVNVLHCPYNTGVYIYVVLLFLAIASGLWFTMRRCKRLWNTALLCLLMLVIGYSSYAVILIRSAANPPMDQNSPDDVFTLASYLARDQYGQRPLLYGQAYTSQPVYEPVAGSNMMRMKLKKGAPVYKRRLASPGKGQQRDEYYVAETQDRVVYAQNMFFPRMWDSQKADAYEQWMGGVSGRMVPYDYGGELVNVKMPSQWENLRFFLSYQCNFMYWRYFMWNFCGRQNDVQGQGELEHGNWITGIPLLDDLRLGNQSLLPDDLRNNKGRNVYYGLPLLLGLLGLFWQGLRRGRRGIQQFWVVFFLFFMTGLAIVVYLNQNPLQVRERDYAYAGSFYAFAIWCGLGVAALNNMFRHLHLPPSLGRAGVGLLPFLLGKVGVGLIPLLMASQNWDDHDRSHRFACRDFGLDYLESCQRDEDLPTRDESKGGHPILFCDGDNDTFPLWYNQEVEEVRTDVRVCNLSYLPTDWYIDQQRRPNANAPALPIPWQHADYAGDKRNYIPIQPELRQQVEDFCRQHPDEARQQFGDEPFELHNILRHWMCNDDPSMQVIPTDSIYLRIDKQAVRESGMMAPDGRSAAMLTDEEIPDRMEISLKGWRGLHKGQLAFLETLANANWRRPVYVCSSVPANHYLNLDEYLTLEGIAERITPFRHQPDEVRIDTGRTYHNLMHRFRYGGLSRPGLYLDGTTASMGWRMRRTFAELALQLSHSDKEKALQVLQRCDRELPAYNLPFNYESGAHYLARAYALLNKAPQAWRHIDAVWHLSSQYLRWILSLPDNRRSGYARLYQQHFAVLYHLVQSAQLLDSTRAEQMSHQLLAYQQAWEQ